MQQHSPQNAFYLRLSTPIFKPFENHGSERVAPPPLHIVAATVDEDVAGFVVVAAPSAGDADGGTVPGAFVGEVGADHHNLYVDVYVAGVGTAPPRNSDADAVPLAVAVGTVAASHDFARAGIAGAASAGVVVAGVAPVLTVVRIVEVVGARAGIVVVAPFAIAPLQFVVAVVAPFAIAPHAFSVAGAHIAVVVVTSIAAAAGCLVVAASAFVLQFVGAAAAVPASLDPVVAAFAVVPRGLTAGDAAAVPASLGRVVVVLAVFVQAVVVPASVVPAGLAVVATGPTSAVAGVFAVVHRVVAFAIVQRCSAVAPLTVALAAVFAVVHRGFAVGVAAAIRCAAVGQ
ncbi:hypothetical protein CBR_g36600 [Chara braunii]|uniref:Uncharacterized protein n=1 Tax=Chara braunii TaxID=69332 RepID=A0A388JZI4_CHABU|nr:hypothetical protein CBR_g36600 [Chara braunii]|eukprot:GBG63113.1 hypothetical protein CBR_g36600 [Chara braunii]